MILQQMNRDRETVWSMTLTNECDDWIIEFVEWMRWIRRMRWMRWLNDLMIKWINEWDEKLKSLNNINWRKSLVPAARGSSRSNDDDDDDD